MGEQQFNAPPNEFVSVKVPQIHSITHKNTATKEFHTHQRNQKSAILYYRARKRETKLSLFHA